MLAGIAEAEFGSLAGKVLAETPWAGFDSLAEKASVAEKREAATP